MTEPKRKSGRPRKSSGEYRAMIGFSLTKSESDLIDELVIRTGLDNRSAVIRFLVKQEMAKGATA